MLSAAPHKRFRLPRFISLVLSPLAFIACQANAPTPSAAQGKPQHTVSTSLCGDAYLQYFAPETIKALSWQARSSLSLATEAQKTLPQIRASAEYVLAYQDNLILFGAGESAGVQVSLPHAVELKWTEDFEGVKTNAINLLMALEPDMSARSGETLKLWEDRLSAIKQTAEAQPGPKPKILYLSRAGGSAGPSTFIDAVITAAGGENINPVAGWHTPDLETLIQYTPDIILTSFSGGDYHSRSDMTHPVLKRLEAGKTVVDINGAFWPCAGPYLVDATEDLQTAILEWQTQRANASQTLLKNGANDA
jgi:iron complex transport system substrate-binding protein